MSEMLPFPEVKFFCGMIYADEGIAREALSRIEARYSAVDMESESFEFDCTDYYEQEMGTPLYRRFFAFRDLLDPTFLPDAKQLTQTLEQEMSQMGKRQVNLDPGYISTAKVVIATAKNHGHRIPLRDGVYAHLEYIAKGGGMRFLEWTYPDFRKPEYVAFFSTLRARIRAQIRESDTPGAALTKG